MSLEPVIHAVDDDRLFLAALTRSLSTAGLAVEPHSSAEAFLERVGPERPGCLVTDLRLPGMDGLELQRRLRERRLRLPIIFITGHGDTAAAVSALKGGAVDFLEKPFSERALLASVEQALAKDAEERRLAAEKATVTERFERLSPREREVFLLVTSDASNKQIARRLKISPRTVEHHREHVMFKMQAHSMRELLTMAFLCEIREPRLSP